MKNKTAVLLSLVLLTALVFNPFGYNIYELPKLAFLSYFTAVTLIILGFHFLEQGKLEIRYNKPIYILLAIWLISLLLSATLSIAPDVSFWGSYMRLQGLYSHLIYLMFFLLFLNTLKDEKSQNIFLKILIAISSITAIYAVLQYFQIDIYSTQDKIQQEVLGRSFSTLGHPNFLGQFLIFPIWAGIYLTQKAKNYKKILPILITLLLLTALLLTQNRSSILGVAIGIALFIILSLKIKTIYKVIISAIPITALTAYIALFAPSIRSISTRLILWKGSLLASLDHPIIGSGLETFKFAYQPHASVKLFELEKLYQTADRAHNEYLDILVQQGLLGFAAYTAAILAILYLLFKKKEYIFSSALISILISNFFSFSVSIHFLLFASILAIILNRTAKFSTLTIKRSLATIIVTLILFITAISLVIVSTKSLYADRLFLKGMNDLTIGKTNEGIENLTNSANITPYKDDIYFMLAGAYLEIGKQLNNDKEILQQGDKVIELAGRHTNYNFQYQLFKALIQTYLENYDIADSHFQKAHSLAPINPVITKEWGNMYHLAKNYPLCIEKIEEFLSTQPNYWTWKNSTDTLTPDQKYKYSTFFKDADGFFDIFGPLADCYSQLGDTEKEDYYRTFINH
ncbi:MAG: O-antigen ligase family protein [Candidatus Peregrinibacteria bacterium]